MTITDPIADCLTTIRNGQRAFKSNIFVLKNKTIIEVCKILQKEGFIKSFVIHSNKIEILLKYRNNTGVIKEITRVSKPSLRLYTSYKDLKPLYNGLGLYIVSTSKGVITDYEIKIIKIGGEVICRVF